MNNTLKTIDRSIVAKALNRIPNLRVSYPPDARELSLHVSGQTLSLQIAMCATGYPRDVRYAVQEARSRLHPDALLLVYAPFLTPAAKDWLQLEDIGYLDGQGNLLLTTDGVYLYVEAPVKPSKSYAPVERNIFRGKAAQILHALLHAPERLWHVTDLAIEAGVASGTAVKVCETLERMLLMEKQGRGPQSLRRLLNPEALLDAWADKHRLETSYTSHRYYRWMSDLDTLTLAIGEAIEQQGASYAVTLIQGAMHRAPFLTQMEQATLLLPDTVDLKRLASDCRLQTAETGYNALLISTRSQAPLMYRQHQDNLWLASDIQIYLDLFASPGRGREQAEHLRRERIGF